jgi:hypothetical protein
LFIAHKRFAHTYADRDGRLAQPTNEGRRKKQRGGGAKDSSLSMPILDGGYTHHVFTIPDGTVGGRQRRRRGVSVSSLFRSLANAGILIALLSAVTGAAVWAMTVVSFLLMVPLALLTRVLPRVIANYFVTASTALAPRLAGIVHQQHAIANLEELSHLLQRRSLP